MPRKSGPKAVPLYQLCWYRYCGVTSVIQPQKSSTEPMSSSVLKYCRPEGGRGEDRAEGASEEEEWCMDSGYGRACARVIIMPYHGHLGRSTWTDENPLPKTVPSTTCLMKSCVCSTGCCCSVLAEAEDQEENKVVPKLSRFKFAEQAGSCKHIIR